LEGDRIGHDPPDDPRVSARHPLRLVAPIMRVRPALGVLVSVCILVVAGFLVFVGLTSSIDTQPMLLIPSILGLVIGLFLCLRVPGNNIGLVVLVAVLSFTLLNTYDLIQEWSVANGHLLLAMVASMSGTAAFGGVLLTLLVLLPIWFPDGVAIKRWSRWVARVGMAFLAIAILGSVFSEQMCVVWAVEGGDACDRYFTNPWGIPGLDGSALEVLYVGLYLLAFPSVVALVMRWRRSTGVERAQLKWFSLVVVLFIVGFLVTVMDESLIDTDFANWVAALTLGGVWLSIGVAVAKYRLYDIDRVISRGLGYVLIVGLLGLVYGFGAVWLPTRVVGEQQPIFVAASTLAVAALFTPVRKRILHRVDRRFYRSKYDAEEVAARFAEQLKAEIDLERLPGYWMSAVVEIVQPSSIGAWVRSS
jgi:hypothetical protein